MSFVSYCIRFTALLLTALLTACGGGSSASAPAGGLTVVAGGGQVTLSWQATGGVDYWLLYGQQNTPIDMSNPGIAAPGSQNNGSVGAITYTCGAQTTAGVPAPGQHLWVTPVTSPCVITGLTDGATYAFAINGRINGGKGGPQTPTVYATPRPAGANWTLGSGLGSNALYGGSYGSTASNGLLEYVAVGDAGSSLYSTDGLTWIVPTGATLPLPSNVNFKSALYLGGVFYAVGVGTDSSGAANNVYSSIDLLNWTPTAAPVTQGLNALATDGTNLVAVGNGGAIVYLSGGVWVAATGGGAYNLNGVAWSSASNPSNGAFWVAVGGTGTWGGAGTGVVLQCTTTLAAWTPSSTVPSTGNLYAVAATPATALTAASVYATNPMAVAVGAAGAVMTSTDGNTWTQRTLPGSVSPQLNGMVADGVQFLAAGQGGAVFSSTDGVTWANPVTTYFSSSIASGVNSSTATTGADVYGLFGSSVLYVGAGAGGVAVTSQ